MRNLLRCWAVVLVVLVISRVGFGQAPKESDLDLVSRYVDQTVIGIVRIDISRVDTDAVVNDIARTMSDMLREKDPASLGASDQQFKDSRESAKKWREKFAAAGGRELFIVVFFNPAADPPFLGIVPTTDDAKKPELVELVKQLSMGGSVREAEGAVIAGPEVLLEGKPLAEPERREEIERELTRRSDAPIQLSLIPSEFVRRAIAENVPELPAEIGGGPSSVLTKGLVSGYGSLALAPNWSLRIVLQSESEEAARALAETLTKGVAHSSQMAGPVVGAELVKALTPRAEGSTVVITMGNERITALKKSLMPAMMAARKAARRMVVASHMRNAVTGSMVYAQDHNDQWPKDLATLVKEGVLTEDMLVNPDRPEMKPGYTYIRPDVELLKKSNWSDHMVVYEAYKEWPKEGVWVAFADGHVHIVTEESEMKRLIEYAMKHKAKD